MENGTDNIRKMNIIVIGESGAGKSTLINAVAGARIKTRAGEGDTQGINIYESTTWPFRCIDTMGFEPNIFKQMKAIIQVRKFTREQVSRSASDEENHGVDAVWYCIDATRRRMFSQTVEMMSNAVKGWKNVPVFAVITKSYSTPERQENIDAVKAAFSKVKGINVQGYFPVVAERFQITDDVVVESFGIAELCDATLSCSEEAAQINSENRIRMIKEQKRFSAQALVVGATTAAVVVGAVPIPFADSAILVPLEIGMTKGVFKIYGVESSADLVSAVVGSAAITNVAKAALGALKTVPNIAGSVINAVVAGFFVGALGEAVVALTESIYSGKVDPNVVDNTVAFVANELKNNAVLGAAISYIEKNAASLKGKTAKEIFEAVSTAVKPKN